MARPREAEAAGSKPLVVRIAWFVGLWATSVVALGVVATILRWALKP